MAGEFPRLEESISKAFKVIADASPGGVPDEVIHRAIHTVAPAMADIREEFGKLSKQLDELRNDGFERTVQRRHEWDLESFRATISAGAATLRAALLITGGGAAALLAFLQALVQGGSPYVGAIAFSLWIMVTAMLCAGVATAATYAGQWCYTNEGKRWIRAGDSFHVIAVITFLAALVGFGAAAWHAYRPFAGS